MTYEINPLHFNSTPKEVCDQAHKLCLEPVIKKDKVILNPLIKNGDISLLSRITLFWCLGLNHQIHNLKNKL